MRWSQPELHYDTIASPLSSYITHIRRCIVVVIRFDLCFSVIIVISRVWPPCRPWPEQPHSQWASQARYMVRRVTVALNSILHWIHGAHYGSVYNFNSTSFIGPVMSITSCSWDGCKSKSNMTTCMSDHHWTDGLPKFRAWSRHNLENCVCPERLNSVWNWRWWRRSQVRWDSTVDLWLLSSGVAKQVLLEQRHWTNLHNKSMLYLQTDSAFFLDKAIVFAVYQLPVAAFCF